MKAKALQLLIISCLSACQISPKTQYTSVQESYLNELIQAKNTQQVAPLYSKNNNEILSLDKAYLIQKKLIKHINKGERIGFKSGLTNVKGQKKFQVNEPIAGIMFNPYLGHSSVKTSTINLNEYHKPMLELELGFQLKKIPTKKITSLAELITYLHQVYPIIELPDLGFEQGSLSAADVIANNSAFHSIIIGDAKTVNKSLLNKINQLKVSLKTQNKRLLQAQSSDALGNQLLSLQWLINHSLEQGYRLRKEDIFITGALGKMIPNKIGNYEAEFEELGTIKFEVIKP